MLPPGAADVSRTPPNANASRETRRFGRHTAKSVPCGYYSTRVSHDMCSPATTRYVGLFESLPRVRSANPRESHVRTNEVTGYRPAAGRRADLNGRG